MKATVFQFLMMGIFISMFLQACNNSAPIQEEPSKETAVAEENVAPQTPPPPPPIDTVEIDTVKPVSKVERPNKKPPYIQFNTPTYRFDTIKAGDIVNYEFKFKNTGERPLEITNVKASCGCTTPSWPFLLFAQGEEGSIKARFDSKGKKGKQESTITVYSNAENQEIKLKMVGYVKEGE